jgi:hypothetical protein
VCAQIELARRRLALARTNGELFLAFTPNSNERNGKNTSWTLYSHLQKDRPDLLVERSESGTGDRFGSLLLVGVGMAFCLLLLIYIAANLFLAALFFVFLVALTPAMLLAPAFGDSGREVFRRWLGHTLAAAAAKLLYAVYLGITVWTASLVVSLSSGTGWMAEWVIFAAFWWLAFHYRTRILALLSAGAIKHHHPGMEALGAVYMMRRAGRVANRRVRRPLVGGAARAQDSLRAGEQRRREHALELAQADRAAGEEARHQQQAAASRQAKEQLELRARQTLDARYQDAQRTLERAPDVRAEILRYQRGGEQRRARRLEHAKRSGAPVAPPSARERQLTWRAEELKHKLSADERLVREVRETERRTGQRYSPQQLRAAGEGLRVELTQPASRRDYARLAYRIGQQPGRYEAASAGEQLRMRQQIDRTIRQDRLLQAAADLRPPPASRAPAQPALAAAGPPPAAADAGARAHRPGVTPVARRRSRGEFPGAREHLRRRRRER